MGSKYRDYQSNRGSMGSDKQRQRIHPVWRGVGFALIVLTPIISWAGAITLIQQNQAQGWFRLPTDLYVRPGDFVYGLIPDTLLYIKLLFFLVIMLALYALFTLVVFIANSMFGVTRRNDPFYVPPVRLRKRRR